MIKLISYEWKKILKAKTVSFSITIVVLVCCLFFGGSILIPQFGKGFSAESYRNLVKKVRSENADKVYEELSENYEKMLDGGIEPEHMYTEAYRQEVFLYQQVLQELENVIGYEEYIQQVLQNADKGNIGIFAKQHSFALEQKKISSDFQKVATVKPEFAGCYSISAAMKTDLWDCAILAILLILVHAIILSEIEENKVSLIRCAKAGREKTVYAKLLCGCIVLVVLQLFVYGFRFIFAGMLYSIPDLSAVFQSVSGARGCTLNLNILEAVLLFLGFKILATISIFVLLFLLGLLIRNTWKFYITGLGVIAGSWIIYECIGANSFLVVLKWLNLAAFMATDSIMMTYRNLNIFDYPIGYRWFVTLTCIILLAVCVFFIGRLYCSVMPQREKMGSEKIFCLLEGIAGNILGGNGIWGYEFRKWFFYQKGFWFCATCIAIAFAVYRPVNERLYTSEEIYYKYYVKQVEGDFQEDKMAYLLEQEKYLLSIQKDLEENGFRYEESVVAFYNQELEKESGLKAAIAYGEYLKETGGNFIYEQGYEILFGKGDGAFPLLLCRLFSLATMTVLSIFIWYIEQSSKMKCLIHISTCGMRKTRCYKYGNVILSGLIVSVITYLPWIYNVFSVFGYVGLNAQANSLQMFESIPGQVSLFAVLILFVVLHMVYLWFIGILVKLLCSRIQNSMVIAVLTFSIGSLFIWLLFTL